MDDVLIVGGGAAGMLAAWRAASLGARTRLLEKNARLGVKIHISGGGKCNITHAGDMESVRQAFRREEARFLHPSFRRFTNQDILALLAERGVGVHTRSDGRVFPDSGRADDVIEALLSRLRQSGVQVDRNVSVVEVMVREGRAAGVRAAGQDGERILSARAVVLAVGGSSYPKTGATGDGFRWARALGHTIVPLRAALAPIYLAHPTPEWSGVSLRDCLVRARCGGRDVGRWRGDLLFTHHGISGPAALGVSREAAAASETGAVSLDVDVLPDLGHEEIAAVLVQEHARGGSRVLRTLLQRWLPDRLVPAVAAAAGADPGAPIHQVARKIRNRLCETLKRWDLGAVRTIPMERGEVTAGGVSLDEVDPQTMASRRVPGLYLCGEILDIAGPVGGYNLQAAFSTGWVAGEGAARDALAGCAAPTAPPGIPGQIPEG